MSKVMGIAWKDERLSETLRLQGNLGVITEQSRLRRFRQISCADCQDSCLLRDEAVESVSQKDWENLCQQHRTSISEEQLCDLGRSAVFGYI